MSTIHQSFFTDQCGRLYVKIHALEIVNDKPRVTGNFHTGPMRIECPIDNEWGSKICLIPRACLEYAAPCHDGIKCLAINTRGAEDEYCLNAP